MRLQDLPCDCLALVLARAGRHAPLACKAFHAAWASHVLPDPDRLAEFIVHATEAHEGRLADFLCLAKSSVPEPLACRVVAMMLAAGADVRARKDDALCNACWYGRVGVASLLLAAGANVHARGDEALCNACWHGRVDLARLLIDAGANVNARGGEPLIQASLWGRHDIARLLIDAGAIRCRESDRCVIS